MARRFVRVDLSDGARDFRPVAIEPGVPMLDSSNATARIMFKWLGGLVAEPEWEGESVNFYVRDDHGGRLEEVACSPASDADLSGPLKDDLNLIKERIAKARPETSTERAVHQVVSDSFAALAEDESRTDRDHYFFKYRDVQGRWRLVWCWGYQRADQQPAATVICPRADCNLLFVRRPGQSPKCPGCEALLVGGTGKRTSRKPAWLLAWILLLIVAGVVYWLVDRGRLTVTPEKWTGPVGRRVQFEVTSPGLFGFGTKDVSKDVLAEIFDAKVVHFDESDCSTIARNPGTTVVRFRFGLRSASVLLTVLGEEKLPAQQVAAQPRVSEVVILSDQGPAVQFPVGAEFDDFRVEARWPDGFTQIVTRKATLRTADEAGQSPLAFSDGRMTGLRPGKTRVEAIFEGVQSENRLEVEVTAEMGVDEIRLAPSALRIVPGETVALEAVGYHGGKSVGVITGLGGLEWESTGERVVRVEAGAVTGVEPGQAAVTARRGSVTSGPAEVSVVESIADDLVVVPDSLQMLVGESRSIGSDLAVLRGQIDLSRQANVTSALPSVVRYVPETHSLRGVSSGVSAVTFTAGDKLATAMVEVLPGGKLEGEVVVEPGGGTLAPGQSLPLRVYLVSEEGHRLDKTDSATLSSSAPETVMIQGNQAWAVSPGSAEVFALLPEAELPGKAYLTVEDGEITELIVQPPRLEMSVGDLGRLRILGRAAGRLRELLPQPDLKVTVGGPNPEAIEIVGARAITAKGPGSAEVTVRWADRATRHVPVAVTDDPLEDLAIDPAEATIYRGQPLVYRVTGMRGGRRVVLGPEDGVSLSVGEPDVAQLVGDLAVVGKGPGQTDVVAQVGQQQAVASLQVSADPGPTSLVAYGPDGKRVWWPGHGYLGLGYDVTYGPGGVIYDPDGQVVYTPGGLVVRGPDSEVRAAPPTDAPRLVVSPEPLELWSGEAATFREVSIYPGGEQSPVEIDYRVTPSPGQDVVTVESGQQLRGLSAGVTEVVVTAVDPTGGYDGLRTTARVSVTSPDRLWIEPGSVFCRVGESTPTFAVMAEGENGARHQVPAALETSDEKVLVPDPSSPGAFRARGLGRTQVRALYRNREAFATVTVTGQRFRDIRTRLNEGEEDFSVRIEVLAADSEGPLEYRVYAAGQAPPEAWVPNRRDGNVWRAVLESPRMPYGPPSARYSLVLEARDPDGGSVERYPFTFRLAPSIERTDSPP